MSFSDPAACRSADPAHVPAEQDEQEQRHRQADAHRQCARHALVALGLRRRRAVAQHEHAGAGQRGQDGHQHDAITSSCGADYPPRAPPDGMTARALGDAGDRGRRAAVLGAAVTARLGVWQLDRAAQKIALQRRHRRSAAAAAADTADLAARRPAAPRASCTGAVRLQGHWSARHTVFLDNRQMNGRPGFFVADAAAAGARPTRCWCSAAGCRATCTTARGCRTCRRRPAPVEVRGPHRPAAGPVVRVRARRRPGRSGKISTSATSRARPGCAAAAVRAAARRIRRAGDGLLREWPRPAARRAQALRLCLSMVRAVRADHRSVCLVPTHPSPTPPRA